MGTGLDEVNEQLISGIARFGADFGPQGRARQSGPAYQMARE